MIFTQILLKLNQLKITQKYQHLLMPLNPLFYSIRNDHTIAPLPSSTNKSNQSRLWPIITILLSSLIVVGLIFFFLSRNPSQKTNNQINQSLQTVKTLQSFTKEDCQALPLCSLGNDCNKNGKTITLKDERDGKLYRVRRFMDNNCWMVDNLAYGGGLDGHSDFCAEKTDPTDLNYWREANSVDGIAATSTNGLNDPMFSTLTLIGNCINPAQNDSNGNPNLCTFSEFGNCGYLYNWAAATQDLTAYVGGDTSHAEGVQGLCPAGWQLPEDVSEHSFIALHLTTGYTWDQATSTGTGQEDFWQTTNQWHGLLTGTFTASYNQEKRLVGNNQLGAIWTSSQNTSDLAASLAFSRTTVNPLSQRSKSDALSLRCLLK